MNGESAAARLSTTSAALGLALAGLYNYEWLSDLGTYLLYEDLGHEAITLFTCVLLAVTAAVPTEGQAVIPRARRSVGESASSEYTFGL